MIGLVGNGAAEGEDYAFGGGESQYSTPSHCTPSGRSEDVIETGIADQGAQVLFVEGDGVLCDRVLLGGPLVVSSMTVSQPIMPLRSM